MRRRDEEDKDHRKGRSGARQDRASDEIDFEAEQNWEEPPLHPNARTTREMRREFQFSEESSRSLARRYDLTDKTVSKHRRRTGVDDWPAGRRSTAFTESEADLLERFRRFTCLNLRDCVERLKPVIPQLNVSNLQRLAKRVGANRLPWGKTTSIERGNSEARLGCFHVKVLQRRFSPATAIVAFGEERGEVFAFYAKPTAQKAARFVVMLKARFPSLKYLITPDDPLFGNVPWRGHPLENELREKYADHPVTRACDHARILRGDEQPIFRDLPLIRV